jgi:DNA-binding LacI/PurR family transcriptional regulator
MATTIKDIAKQAGVSHTTVSRAMHGSPLISTETTQRIQKIAAELNYHPSFAARSLKTNRTQVLGVIVSRIDDPFFSEILQGIDDIAQTNGYSLFIAASQQDLARERAIVRAMQEHRVDGVILCSPRFTLDQSDPLHSYNIPVVAVNNQSEDDYPFSIYHDDVDGARQICEHLINLGHKRIGYLGDATAGRTTKERMTGFQQSMNNAGISIQARNVHLMPGNSADQGFTAVSYFLNLERLPSALICYNDMMAVGVLKGFISEGLRVPADISITGFDNITISDYTYPPLTTIDQPKRYLGAEAARLLLEQLNKKDNSNQSGSFVKRLKGNLLVRQSTTAPPIG